VRMNKAVWMIAPALAGSALLTLAGTQAQVLKGHDSNAPVDFSADRIEVQDRADRVVVTGNVQVTQGNLRLSANRLTVAYRRTDGVEINRLDAVGDVLVTRGNESARGATAVYDLDRRIITMVGNVQLVQGESRLTGGRLTIDLANGRSSVDGSPGVDGSETGQGDGRVSGTFKVRQN